MNIILEYVQGTLEWKLNIVFKNIALLDFCDANWIDDAIEFDILYKFNQYTKFHFWKIKIPFLRKIFVYFHFFVY